MRLFWWMTLLLATACAQGATDVVAPGVGGAAGAPGGSGGRGGDGAAGGDDPGWSEQACPPGELLIGFGSGGELVCGPIDDLTRATVNDGCAVYLGWRDGCSGCTLGPAKWGWAAAAACNIGAGGDNTCTTPTLGNEVVHLFGLNTDGSVDNNDKLYAGLHCQDPGATTSEAGPCEPSERVVEVTADGVRCAPVSQAVLAHVRDRCFFYFGWRDSCDGCTSAPSKWGRANDTFCQDGAGAGNSCETVDLGGETVQLFGLDLDGDVDGNDKLYFGLHCLDATAASAPANGACPAGQFVVGTHADGTVECQSPSVAIESYFRSACVLHAGWRDGCDACTSPPAKSGRVWDGVCVNDVGVDSTCSTAILGSETVELYGLNFDGDVDGNDKLYVGFRCH